MGKSDISIRSLNPFVCARRLMTISLLLCSCVVAAALDGQFKNHGTVLVARKDMPNETVTLTGLLLAGTGFDKVTSASFRTAGDVLVVDFSDDKGAIVASEEFTADKNNLSRSEQAISFDKVFSSTNESGRMLLRISYHMRTGDDGRLIVETILNYKTKRILFSTSGKDRGVYAFARLK